MEDKPAYGTITHLGGEWSVTFKKTQSKTKSWSTGTHSGYGEFPFTKFPGLPVIDFKSAKWDDVWSCIKILDNYTIVETEIMPFFPKTEITVNKYLDMIRKNNVNVIRR